MAGPEGRHWPSALTFPHPHTAADCASQTRLSVRPALPVWHPARRGLQAGMRTLRGRDREALGGEAMAAQVTARLLRLRCPCCWLGARAGVHATSRLCIPCCWPCPAVQCRACTPPPPYPATPCLLPALPCSVCPRPRPAASLALLFRLCSAVWCQSVPCRAVPVYPACPRSRCYARWSRCWCPWQPRWRRSQPTPWLRLPLRQARPPAAERRTAPRPLCPCASILRRCCVDVVVVMT